MLSFAVNEDVEALAEPDEIVPEPNFFQLVCGGDDVNVEVPCILLPLRYSTNLNNS